MAKHEMNKFKVDHDDEDKSDDVVNPSPLLVVHPHQMTQEEGGLISDHDDKDISEDVVNPSLQEEGGDEDEFDEDYPPIRRVEEFTDDYGLIDPYFMRFPFDDEDFDDEVEDFDYEQVYGHPCSKTTHQTILRYIKQIRESFAFDLDCRPPRWFYIARLKPIVLSEGYFKSKSFEKVYKDFVDLVLKSAKVAVEEDINYAIRCETSGKGKGFKFVGVEKGVTSCTYFVLFLTINVMEVEVANVTIQEDGDGALMKRKIIQADGDGDGAEGEGALKKRKIVEADGDGGEGEGASVKTIQAILGRNSHGDYLVEQWRMKPDAEDA